MEWRFLFCVLTVSLAVSTNASYSGCSQGRQRVVSYDTTLVPPSGVSASSQPDEIFNSDDLLFHRNNLPLRLWCSEKFEKAVRNTSVRASFYETILRGGDVIMEINVTFSEPLLLTHILSTGFSNGYVSNFTVEQSLTENGPLQVYNNSRGNQEFVVEYVDAVLALNPPLPARKLRFNILDGEMTPSGRLCWHLSLLGCTLDEASSQPQNVGSCENISASATTPPSPLPECTVLDTDFPPPTPSSLSPSPSLAPSPSISSSPSSPPSSHTHTVTPTPSNPSPSPITTTDGVGTPCIVYSSPAIDTNLTITACSYKLMLIVIPSVSGGLLLVSCCIITFICIGCLTCKMRKSSQHFSQTDLDTLEMVDNDLYRSKSSVFPAHLTHVSSVQGNINRAGFGRVGRNRMDSMSTEPHYENCSSVISGYRGSLRDSLDPKIATVTTDIEQSSKSVDSMVVNPNYNIPYPKDYHSLSTRRNRPPPVVSIASLNNRRISTIDMVDNACYYGCSSLDTHYEGRREQNFDEESPSDYEMPN